MLLSVTIVPHLSISIIRSTLEPLLFLIYINDLEDSILINPRLFADDSCICVNADTISNLEYLINSELLRVNNWQNANKLILNALKSKALIIPPKTRQQAPNLEITIDSCQISVVESVKYLGICLNNKLTFGPHISYLQSKLSRSIGIISKIKFYVPDRVLLLLYFALFHSHITYGLIIWYSTYKTYTSKTSKLQNRIIKIITKSNPREKVLPLFKKYGILTLDDLFTYAMAALTFKYRSNNVPYNLSQYFTLTSDIHKLNTRSCSFDTYYLPRFKTNKLQHSIKFTGVKVWNKIPNKFFSKNLKLLFCRGGVEDTRLEAKAKDTKKSEAKDSLSEDIPSRGQGQECLRLRPRTKDTAASVLKKKKKVFKKVFQAISNL